MRSCSKGAKVKYNTASNIYPEKGLTIGTVVGVSSSGWAIVEWVSMPTYGGHDGGFGDGSKMRWNVPWKGLTLLEQVVDEEYENLLV